MTTEYVDLQKNMKVSEAIEEIRKLEKIRKISILVTLQKKMEN